MNLCYREKDSVCDTNLFFSLEQHLCTCNINITVSILINLHDAIQLWTAFHRAKIICSMHLTLKVLNFWKFTSCCSLKPLRSAMGEVVPARTSLTLHPPSPPTVHQSSWLALLRVNYELITLLWDIESDYCSPNKHSSWRSKPSYYIPVICSTIVFATNSSWSKRSVWYPTCLCLSASDCPLAKLIANSLQASLWQSRLI